MGFRFSLFYSSTTVAGAFGGLLAAAIVNMDGMGNLSGWQWIFLLEGILAVLAGMASYRIIQDFPHEAKFLSEEESRPQIEITEISTDWKFHRGVYHSAPTE